MSAALRVGRVRGAPEVSGWLIAVRLWNYSWQDPFGEMFAMFCSGDFALISSDSRFRSLATSEDLLPSWLAGDFPASRDNISLVHQHLS